MDDSEDGKAKTIDIEMSKMKVKGCKLPMRKELIKVEK
jgi:hypothetical protein